MALWKKRRLALFLLCSISLAPLTAYAEWMGDIYLGGSYTRASNGDFVLDDSVTRALKNTDSSTPLGARLGYWFERASWFGVALDISVFTPAFQDKGPAQPAGDVTLTQMPISFLFMVRYPVMPSDKFGNGRLQPYLAAGPSLVFGSLSEFAGAAVPSPAVLEDTSWSLGFDIRAGLTYMIGTKTGAFIEYRYLRTQPAFESATGGGTVRYEPTLTTSTGVIGISFRF